MEDKVSFTYKRDKEMKDRDVITHVRIATAVLRISKQGL